MLEHVSLSILRGEKVGLVGRNGSGKSSLLALLRGELSADSGECEVPSHLAIASVAQELPHSRRAVVEHVIDGDEALRTLEARLTVAEQAGDGLRQAALLAEVETSGGYTARSRAASLLDGLGFDAGDIDRPLDEFSGGLRMRANLARALMCRSDVLLLDEPTNHLDLDAVLWLEDWLCAYSGTLLLVSHDREFLDAVATRIFHLSDRGITSYTGNFSHFETQRAAGAAQRRAADERLRREIAHVRSFVDRFRAKASKARQAQSRLKMLERMAGAARQPLEITTFCDAPVGSGLGASSTLVVAMVKAYAELWNVPLDDYETAHLAFHTERVDCGLAGGRQDQYSAAFGGFNFMEFYAEERAVINPLRIKPWVISELEASLLLFYTGVSRESARIIDDQKSGVQAGSEQSLTAMRGLKQEASVMKECLLKGNFGGIVDSMRQGWENKKKSARTVSNAHIDGIYDAACASGALAGKVSGAGGGGFMMLFAPPDKQPAIRERLRKLIHVPFRFEYAGSQIIFYDHETDYSAAERDRAGRSIEAFSEL